MEKINIAELLKDCPKGMELDCTVYNDVTFLRIDEVQNRCYFKAGPADTFWTTCEGRINGSHFAKCVIFPKGKTTWEGFVPSCKFKDGDVVYIETTGHNHNEFIIIFKEIKNDHIHKYACFAYQVLSTCKNAVCHLVDVEEVRLATEEEKQKLFDAIKANGYKWNAETKTLEKLIEQKFDITTLVPFESKVLVRDWGTYKWLPAVWGFYDDDSQNNYPYYTVGGQCYKYCIPYEGNEHLRGKKDDCDEFYKIWE